MQEINKNTFMMHIYPTSQSKQAVMVLSMPVEKAPAWMLRAIHRRILPQSFTCKCDPRHFIILIEFITEIDLNLPGNRYASLLKFTVLPPYIKQISNRSSYHSKYISPHFYRKWVPKTSNSLPAKSGTCWRVIRTTDWCQLTEQSVNIPQR